MIPHTNNPYKSTDINDGDFIHVIFKDKREIKGYASFPHGSDYLLSVGGWVTINLNDISPVSSITVLHKASVFMQAFRHDNKSNSEEMCVRCGWVMGSFPLNCSNDDTPHIFPSQFQEQEQERNNALIREIGDISWAKYDSDTWICPDCETEYPYWQEECLHPQADELAVDIRHFRAHINNPTAPCRSLSARPCLWEESVTQLKIQAGYEELRRIHRCE